MAAVAQAAVALPQPLQQQTLMETLGALQVALLFLQTYCAERTPTLQCTCPCWPL